MKINIEEIIVVEGRDDTNAVNAAVNALTIETHGFGIRKETWDMIKYAYETKGIIIFTDPDYSGEEIRRRLLKAFPNAKQAFLARSKATQKGDIGIENAKPEDIIDALKKAHCTLYVAEKNADKVTQQDLVDNCLVGSTESKERREKLGDILGIGYSNAKGLLKKLDAFGICREKLEEAVKKL